MRTSTDVTETLGAMPLFAGVSKRALRRIAQLVQPTTIQAGRLVMREQYRGEQVHVIVSGHAVVTRGGETIAILGTGDLLGEIGLLDGADRNATVTAETDLRMLTFDEASFDRLMHDHPDIAQRIRAAAAARRTDSDQIL